MTLRFIEHVTPALGELATLQELVDLQELAALQKSATLHELGDSPRVGVLSKSWGTLQELGYSQDKNHINN